MRSTVDEHEVPSAADPAVGGAGPPSARQDGAFSALRVQVPSPDHRAPARKHDEDFLELRASLEDAVRAQHHGIASKGSGT